MKEPFASSYPVIFASYRLKHPSRGIREYGIQGLIVKGVHVSC